jgi:hypothetical protein
MKVDSAPSAPARARRPTTCWCVAVRPEHDGYGTGGETWYEREERARAAFDREAEDGRTEVWLLAPGDTPRVVAYVSASCARCNAQGYMPHECAGRVVFPASYEPQTISG